MPKSVDLLFITLSSPIKVGIYEDNRLIESIETHEKSSDVLPKIFEELSKKYKIKKPHYLGMGINYFLDN